MSSMRGIDTPVRQRRRRVFKEVANLAYNSTNLKDDMEALPYKIVDYEESEFWESVYRDRAIIRERIRPHRLWKTGDNNGCRFLPACGDPAFCGCRPAHRSGPFNFEEFSLIPTDWV